MKKNVRQPSRSLKILIKTNEEGKIEVFNQEDGSKLDNVSNLEIFVNSQNRPYVRLIIKNPDLEIKYD